MAKQYEPSGRAQSHLHFGLDVPRQHDALPMALSLPYLSSFKLPGGGMICMVPVVRQLCCAQPVEIPMAWISVPGLCC